MKKPMTYKKAGVDISKADGLLKGIRKLIDTTNIDGSLGSVGGFGGFFDLSRSGEKGPILVSSTDGVGTKLKIAQIADKHDTVGIDLVAMCVNDVLCSGARPVFFLDYFACGKLEGRVWRDVLKGIVKGCREAGCALLGGETAEMPGMYGKGEYDLAGFSVGTLRKKDMIDGSKIKPGDILLGIASSGLHSNGFSLVRKVFTEAEMKKNKRVLLKPTVIYVKPFLALSDKVRIKGAAHITGGGLYENVPRILPDGADALIRKGSWSVPPIFKELRKRTRLDDGELYRTFNMGVGMVLALSEKEKEKAVKVLKEEFGLKSWVIGEITRGKRRAILA